MDVTMHLKIVKYQNKVNTSCKSKLFYKSR